MRNVLAALAAAATLAITHPSAAGEPGVQLAADFPPGVGADAPWPAQPPYQGTPGAIPEPPPYRPRYSEPLPDPRFVTPRPEYRAPMEAPPPYRDPRYAEPRPDDGPYGEPAPGYHPAPGYDPAPGDRPRYVEPRRDDGGPYAEPGYRPRYADPRRDDEPYQRPFYDRGPRYSEPGAGQQAGPELRPPAPIYGAPACDWPRRDPYWDGYQWVQPRQRGCN